MWITSRILLAASLVLASCSYLPQDQDLPNGLRTEENRDYILLEPLDSASLSKTGFLFYPGGLVDPHAYMEMAGAFALSGSGHRVLIAKMPTNLAVLNAGAARKILQDHADLDWVIGGHSLGGAMACSEVNNRSQDYKGLVLMASYPPSSADLSSWPGEVLSISASKDLVVDIEKYESAKSLLPKGMTYTVIMGGNHSGFGSYGFQQGDGEAVISREEQQRITVSVMQNFFIEHGLE